MNELEKPKTKKKLLQYESFYSRMIPFSLAVPIFMFRYRYRCSCLLQYPIARKDLCLCLYITGSVPFASVPFLFVTKSSSALKVRCRAADDDFSFTFRWTILLYYLSVDDAEAQVWVTT